MKIKIKTPLTGLVAKTGLLVPLFLLPALALAKASATPNSWMMETRMEHLILLLGLTIVLWVLVALANMFRIMMKTQLGRIYQEQGIEEMVKVSNTPSTGLWTWLGGKMTSAAPVEPEADVMLDHNYDGIRELDNSLPPWWVAMFYISIIVGVAYFGYYHVLDKGVLQEEAYAQEMEVAEKAKAAFVARQTNQVNENNVVALTMEPDLELGKTVYTTFCVACHGASGEGGVGPNLTDDYWINGGDIKDVFRTIKYGVPEKGMIAWQDQMPPADMHRVASYLMTLIGTAPPNGKEPQGELYQAGEEPPQADSTRMPAIGLKE